ncbi:MAG: LysM peptidoglycan-binding domain-containing protein [Candidatus Limnocylindrales bacterium]
MADPSPNALARAALPWVVATVVVLAVAVTTGFVVAYLVASGRAVDAPGAGLASATPRNTTVVSLAPGQTPDSTPAATIQPRRTPTPAPVITPEPSPFIHVIARGENLRYIAGLYCTTVDAILEINDIANPNRIQVGQELLIPGSGCSSPEPGPA